MPSKASFHQTAGSRDSLAFAAAVILHRKAHYILAGLRAGARLLSYDDCCEDSLYDPRVWEEALHRQAHYLLAELRAGTSLLSYDDCCENSLFDRRLWEEAGTAGEGTQVAFEVF